MTSCRFQKYKKPKVRTSHMLLATYSFLINCICTLLVGVVSYTSGVLSFYQRALRSITLPGRLRVREPHGVR